MPSSGDEDGNGPGLPVSVLQQSDKGTVRTEGGDRRVLDSGRREPTTVPDAQSLVGVEIAPLEGRRGDLVERRQFQLISELVEGAGRGGRRLPARLPGRARVRGYRCRSCR
jgi:hypothetical protein